MKSKKYILAMCVTVAMCCFSHGATVGVIPGALNDGIKYYWNFDSGSNTVIGSNWNGSFGYDSSTHTGTMGTISDRPWKDNLGMDLTSFTVSLDISNLTGNAWADIYCLETAKGKIKIEINNTNEIYCYTPFGNVNLGSAFYTQLTGNNLSTFTFTGDDTSLKFYLDGVLIGSMEHGFLPTDDTSLTGMQFGQQYGGQHQLTSAIIDNVIIWDRPLSQSEILALTTIPEPSTATLGLLGLGALMLRRRRAM